MFNPKKCHPNTIDCKGHRFWSCISPTIRFVAARDDWASRLLSRALTLRNYWWLEASLLRLSEELYPGWGGNWLIGEEHKWLLLAQRMDTEGDIKISGHLSRISKTVYTPSLSSTPRSYQSLLKSPFEILTGIMVVRSTHLKAMLSKCSSFHQSFGTQMEKNQSTTLLSFLFQEFWGPCKCALLQPARWGWSSQQLLTVTTMAPEFSLGVLMCVTYSLDVWHVSIHVTLCHFKHK